MKKKKIIITLIAAGIISTLQQNSFAEKIHHTEAESMNHASNIFQGSLIDTFNSGGYTYVEIKTSNGKVWAAGPVTPVNKGDQIAFNGQMPMQKFHSKTLNRDFDTIYFVSQFSVNGKNMSSAKNGNLQSNSLDPHKNTNKKPHDLKLKSFNKAKDGQTIADIIENKNKFNHQTLKVRGQVSKFTADVMGKNWIHIRDSSSKKQDLTVTTNSSVALNDIITVEGKLTLNKDFGYGYVYDVIIEDAKVSNN